MKKQSKVKYIHFTYGSANPRCKMRRGTIAFQFTEEPGVFKADIAFCSPKDQFSKKIGRFISEGRLKKGGNTFYLSEENPGVANAVLNNLDQFSYSPQCLQRKD